MAKKQKCPEFENHERWLVAYADMMTLLFALFVVLYALGMADMKKMKQVAVSVQKAFGVDPTSEGAEGNPRGNNLNDGIFKKIKGNSNRDSLLRKNQSDVQRMIQLDTKLIERQIYDEIYGKLPLVEQLAEANRDRVVFVSSTPEGINVSLMTRKFFKPSSTELTSESKQLLTRIAGSIQSFGRVIRIEGHTDSLPFNYGGITNWELSAGRAASVVRYLIVNNKFDPKMIYAAGFADTKPAAPNDTPENRALNRRVDIKILYQAPSGSTPSRGSADETEIGPNSNGAEQDQNDGNDRNEQNEGNQP